ncbi:MAG: Dam family site-specific DNA-(adenine-N6)-methyltransferase [Firmicutes bacterium]|nr:Dam family site-specific DNA-(adenine-N6)-methyltransferase [Bacillota bacterium]
MTVLQKKFGERVKSIRMLQGISQIRLTELTGIVREQISRIENGQINPTLETIAKLSIAFNVTLSELMDIPVENNVRESGRFKIKPFVKWAGGKTQILDKIRENIPNNFNTYYEPFLGGGAVLFDLAPKSAVISDSNQELISAFRCFQNRNNYVLLVEELLKHQSKHSEDYYYQIREIDRTPEYKDFKIFSKAARMIYLNKACFNGLYRVNSKGYFNVPSGKYEKVNTYDEKLFENIYEYLSNNKIKIISEDFEKVVESAKQGDFVYFDPPYDTFDEQKNFTAYSKDAFGKDEQARLARVYRELSNKGVYVMLSNHNTELIKELYLGFNIQVIQAKRSINSKATGRGNVEEVVITNY